VKKEISNDEQTNKKKKLEHDVQIEQKVRTKNYTGQKAIFNNKKWNTPCRRFSSLQPITCHHCFRFFCASLLLLSLEEDEDDELSEADAAEVTQTKRQNRRIRRRSLKHVIFWLP
jgi:hypothetical protein